MCCVIPGIAGDIGVVKAGAGLLVTVVVPEFDMRSPSRHFIARFDDIGNSVTYQGQKLAFRTQTLAWLVPAWPDAYTLYSMTNKGSGHRLRILRRILRDGFLVDLEIT